MFAIGCGRNWVRLVISCLPGVEGQRTAVPIGRNWLRFVNDVCRRVAGSAGEIGFVSRSFV